MPTLRIQHSVPNFEGWKRAFDSDPADRKGSGVRRYSVSRSMDDQNLVMIDLEFDDAEDVRGNHIFGYVPDEDIGYVATPPYG